MSFPQDQATPSLQLKYFISPSENAILQPQLLHTKPQSCREEPTRIHDSCFATVYILGMCVCICLISVTITQNSSLGQCSWGLLLILSIVEKIAQGRYYCRPSAVQKTQTYKGKKSTCTHIIIGFEMYAYGYNHSVQYPLMHSNRKQMYSTPWIGQYRHIEHLLVFTKMCFLSSSKEVQNPKFPILECWRFLFFSSVFLSVIQSMIQCLCSLSVFLLVGRFSF